MSPGLGLSTYEVNLHNASTLSERCLNIALTCMHTSVYWFGGADIQELSILDLLWKKGV